MKERIIFILYQAMFELYTDDNKSKYSSNPKDILKSANKKKTKTKNEKSYTKRIFTTATIELVWKIPNRKKLSNYHLNLYETEISLDEIIKSINSKTNNKNLEIMMALQQNFINFSNELGPVLLDIYDFRGKLETMGVVYRTGIIFAIYKRR